jgi:prevent-host-death family protein
MKVSVAAAKNKLPELIRAAENGEHITICRRGKPVADLVRTSKSDSQKPKLGTMRNKIVIHDPDWWKPMTDEEVDALLENSAE